MIVTHKLRMDLLHCGANPPVLDMVVGDGESRAVKLLLTAGNEDWTVPELTAVRIKYATPGGPAGNWGSYDTLPDGTKAWSVEDSTVTVILAPHVTARAGLMEMQVELQQEDKTLSTFVFHLDIQRNVPDVDGYSENYVNWAAWALEQIALAVEQIKELGGIKGDEGVGIASVEQTVTSEEDGGINEITLTLSDGSSAVFTVRNGSRGSSGPQGEKGDTGPAGVGIASVEQTTVSTEDGGANVVTVTLTDGQTSTVTIYNGSQGSAGAGADTSALEAQIAALEERIAALESGGTAKLAAPVIQLVQNS